MKGHLNYIAIVFIVMINVFILYFLVFEVYSFLKFLLNKKELQHDNRKDYLRLRNSIKYSRF